MFKARSGTSAADPAASPAAPVPSIETLRRRARRRLIGASVLVLLGIVGLPLLFDTQPRPVPVDIAIEIPAREPATLPVLPAASAEPAAPAPAPAPAAPAAAAPAPAPALAPAAPPSPPPASPAPPAPAPATRPAAPAPATPPSAEANRAQAILEGRMTPPAGTSAPAPAAPAAAATPAAPQRVVVQVGAFEDAARVREVRQRLERAGLVTYIQVAQTPDGPRTRVRLGPFASRAEAERAAERVRALGLPATLLML